MIIEEIGYRQCGNNINNLQVLINDFSNDDAKSIENILDKHVFKIRKHSHALTWNDSEGDFVKKKYGVYCDHSKTEYNVANLEVNKYLGGNKLCVSVDIPKGGSLGFFKEMYEELSPEIGSESRNAFEKLEKLFCIYN